MNYIYGKAEYLHLRPTLIPAKRSFRSDNLKKKNQDVPNPHEYEPYNYITSFLKFIVLWLDYTFGYLKILFWRLKGRVVISDRYFYDMLIDPRRFRIRELGLGQKLLLKWLTPKPTISLFLDVDPEVVFKRKKDLTLDEIRRQMNLYNKRLSGYVEVCKVDANGSADEVQAIVGKILLIPRK
jgi:hypothetical protein